MSKWDITKPKVTRALGIDCSSYSLAYACFEGEKALYCGEIFFEGNTWPKRLKDARAKTQALLESPDIMGSGGFRADYVAIEAAIAVKSVKTAITLAYFFGAVMSVLLQNGADVITVPPITWQTFIGNPNLKPAEKAAIVDANPGRKASWYQNEGRKFRKQRTLAFARRYFTIPSDSDNIGDAVGVAYYAANHLTRKA